jgi:hypothetical protein
MRGSLVRSLLSLIFAATLALSGAASSAPDFAPNPKQTFQGFVSINPPRADVPVGALWIDGYGPTGEGASADNLETVRSLSNINIDKNLQLALTLGVLNLLGIDPKASDHYTAHFSDLSIIRVKDLARLSGPKGEPRIIEALKAGDVTVSSASDVGLGGERDSFQSAVTGSGNGDRNRSYSIEAHDMFIALHVATPEVTRGPDRELRISDDGTRAKLDDFLVLISPGSCGSFVRCAPRLGLAKVNSEAVVSVDPVQLQTGSEADLKLPLPIADGAGGLFDSLSVRWLAPCSEMKAEGCARNGRILVHYEGTLLKDLSSPHAKGW